jgi:hypothetical protein
MVKENTFGKMVHIMRDSLRMALDKEREYGIILKMLIIRANLKMILSMVMENKYLRMETNIKVNLLKI